MNNAALNSSPLNSFPGGTLTPGTVDTGASLVVSGYKWLTSTLLLAQQQFNLRPFFQCKIKDDSIVPQQMLSNPNQPTNGQVIAAPDGKLLAVGGDSNGNLGFWKISDGTQLSQWTATPNVILVTPGNWSNTYNAAIAVSSYIQGSYVIDVYYWQVVAGELRPAHRRSTNGGASFLASNGVSSTGITSPTTDNVYLAAATPVLQSSGAVDAMVMWIRNIGTNQYVIDYTYADDGSLANPFVNGNVQWSTQQIDSQDWSLHSFDVFRQWSPTSDIFYIVFAGYHTIFEQSTNFSLYATKLLRRTNSSVTDIWFPAQEVLTSLSASPQNRNTFTLPKFNFDGTYLWLVFRGVTTDTIREDGTVTTKTNFYFKNSKDFMNFNYPTQFVFTDGTEFSDTNAYSFPMQGSYFFLVGSGKLWSFAQNSIVADVSNDLLSFSVDETAGASSSISLSIGNQNGQWFGPSPTKSGAAAIAKNKKIFLYQGYYNASGVAELAPRNTFFVDDIQQQISSTQNSLTVVGRDLSKKTKITISRFSFNYRATDYYVDPFDGSTIGNWNQVNGTWQQTSSLFQPTVAPASGTEFIVNLAGMNIKNASAMMYVFFVVPDPANGTNTEVTVYPYWKDSRNWLRFRMTGAAANQNTWFVEKSVNGSIGTLDTATVGFGYSATLKYLPLWIRQYNYQTFNFILPGATDSLVHMGNVSSFDDNSGNLLRNSTDGIYNLSGVLSDSVTTIALGVNGFLGGFGNFKMSQYFNSQNIKEVVTSLGTRASIYDYLFQNVEES